MNQWLEQHRTLVFAVVGLLLAIAIGSVALLYRQPETIAIVPPGPTSPPLPTNTPGPIQVYVSGAVNQPAVYDLPPDCIVQDAILAAGGHTVEADLSHINLAQPLHDGEHVYVPVEGEEPTPAPDAPPTTPTPSGPININTASLEELDWLPGIGEGLAQRIIDYRESHGAFTSIEQIMNVSGIGSAKYDGIRDLIVVCDGGEC